MEVELTEGVSSKTAKAGDRFGIRLAGDIKLGGRVVLTGGGSGYGEVVDAAPAKTMGRPGKLILVARALDLGQTHLKLRGFSLPSVGHDASKPVTTFASVPYAGLLAIGMTGGNVEYAAGVHAVVKLAADVSIPAAVPGDAIPAVATAPIKDPQP